MRRRMAILIVFSRNAGCSSRRETFICEMRLYELDRRAGDDPPRRMAHKRYSMKMTMFHKPMMRAAVLALCTATLSAAPMLMAQDTAAPPPPPQQQDNMGPPPGAHAGRRGGRQVEMLTKRLNLTPDQVTQVKAIDADSMSQMKALREDTTTAKADKRSKMMEIHQASQDKIRNILTDEQKAKFDAMQAKMKSRRQSHEGAPAGAPAPPPPPQ